MTPSLIQYSGYLVAKHLFTFIFRLCLGSTSVSERTYCQTPLWHIVIYRCTNVPIEFKLRLKKWLLIPMYSPPCQNFAQFKEELERVIDFYSNSYDNHMIIGDLKLEIKDPLLHSLMGDRNLNSLIISPTCFRSVTGRCIDLILTNNSTVASLAGILKQVSVISITLYTILKTTSVELPPK